MSEREPRTTELGPGGHEWAKTSAGFDFVTMMIPRADDKQKLMWFGWALREAFVAGAEWQEKRDVLKAADEIQRLRRAVAFARSVIKSGEPWTETCERELTL